MHTIIACLFGLVGLTLGFKLPSIALEIMKYKKKDNLEITKHFLFSNLSNIIFSLTAGSVWFVTALFTEDIVGSLLINILITIGLIIAFIDVNIRIIPNELVLAIIIVGLVFQVISLGFNSILVAFICMVAMMAVFSVVAGFMGFGKVGAGDVKLAGAIGLALGYPLIIIGVIVIALSLLVFIAIGLLIKKIYLSTMLPMAPFMIAGFVVALLTTIV